MERIEHLDGKASTRDPEVWKLAGKADKLAPA